jgi:hypothetical protein
MASLHELRELPAKGDYFLSFDNLLEVVPDASIKYKFSFQIPHKDPKRAVQVYKSSLSLKDKCLFEVLIYEKVQTRNDSIWRGCYKERRDLEEGVNLLVWIGTMKEFGTRILPCMDPDELVSSSA